MAKIKYQNIQNKDFSVIKDFTVMAAGVFSASAALSAGKVVNAWFVWGEFFLLVSVGVGFLYLWSVNRGRESLWYLDNISDLELKRNDETVKAEKFLKDATEDLINDFRSMYESQMKSIPALVLRFVKIDNLPSIFFVSVLLGVVLIWVSLFG